MLYWLRVIPSSSFPNLTVISLRSLLRCRLLLGKNDFQMGTSHEPGSRATFRLPTLRFKKQQDCAYLVVSGPNT